MSEFVDSNVFLRFLLSDDPEKTARCLALFQRARRGEAHLVTSESVVAEIVYVLSSPNLYRLPRATIASGLRPLLEIKGLMLDHKTSVLNALDAYAQTNIDFTDCLSVEHMRRTKLDRIYSYDRHVNRISDIDRLEP